MKKYIFAIVITLCLTAGLAAQDYQTAETLFDSVAAVYAAIDDYEADVSITSGDNASKAVMYYKFPSKMRVNYDEPEDQVLVVDAERLALYLPDQHVTLVQDLRGRNIGNATTLGSREGLSLLKRGYKIAYLESPDPVQLDDKTPVKVIKLKLDWRSADQGFRTIELAIDFKTKMIRRISGVTRESEFVQIDFIKIKTNQNIPDSRFDYEIPPEGHVVDDFIFDTSE
ncbi:MAG: outer membrane lipoprotein carrier protein LolA [Spirochaetales bacterium]|nr:outer membrane lipoprotein carrier protein LolA [Spirochaetales bacterium]